MYDFKKVEEEAGKFWKKQSKEIKKSLEYNSKKKLFSFLEGPPTANAPPALHHVEVRVFKDLFCRFKAMQGFNVPRKAGWDCHGLPVEVQVEKALSLNSKKDILSYGIDKFNKKARESVFSYIKEWDKLTEKMAYWIDLDNPYVTLENNYIESVWWSLKEIYKKKMLYEGHKVVPFCPRCETPLSSHEVALGYKDVTEETVTVKFKLKNEKNKYFLAWTSTAWTLPSNLALAVGKEIDYVYVKFKGDEYILAKELVNKYFDEPEIIKTVKGKELEGVEYEPVFLFFKNLKSSFKVIFGNFVSTDEGTGIVHMAPAFGEDDYDVCKKEGIDFVQPITPDGKFTSEVKGFEGMFVKDADEPIIEYLDNKKILFKKEKYTHTYPFCWRCKSALIYYAMKSWFIRVSEIRDKLLKNNEKIKWYPEHIKDGRFGKWLEGAKDWALSRSKFWGTPLPIWRCGCGEEEIIGSIKELKEKSVKKLGNINLHKPEIDKVELKCKCGKNMKRVKDVIDCWYDSGSASFAQYHYPFENKELFEKSFPYDFISEATDKTSGWFYTLHVLGVILFGKNSYKRCVCAGLLVDEKGEKMSKSKGNVLNPWESFEAVGVDAVRLQFCNSEPGDIKRFGVHLVNESVMPFLTILYNCYRFAKQFDGDRKLEVEDKWIISKVNSLVKKITLELEEQNYHHCISEFINFVNEDFSRWYIRLIRDGGNKKVLEYVFDKLIRLLAPFAPYVCDYINLDLLGNKKSVHLSSWPEAEKIDDVLEGKMDLVREIVARILTQREKIGLGIRWPLGKVVVEVEEDLEKFADIIKNQTNVKNVELKKGKFLVKVDSKITKELEQEGYAREVMRKIQDLRKKNKFDKKDRIKLNIQSDYNISKFSKEIKERVGAKEISFDEKKYKISSKVEIKDEEFEISFQKV